MPVDKVAQAPVFKGLQTWYYDPMKENNMNLYIIEDVLSDYTFGMAVIAAPSLERCRELFIAEFGAFQSNVSEYDQAIMNGAYKVLSVVSQPEGVVSYVYGGG